MIRKKLPLFLLLLILLASFVLRVVWLTEYPICADGDASGMAMKIQEIVKNLSMYNKIPHDWTSLHFFFIAGYFKIFDNQYFALRFFSAIEGVMSILFLFLLVKLLYDEKMGLVAAAFLSFNPLHIHQSRLGLGVINMTGSSSLALYFLIRGVREKKYWLIFLAGITGGYAAYFYLGFTFIVGLSAFALLIFSLTEKIIFKRFFFNLLFFVLGFGIAFFPVFKLNKSNPNKLFSRFKQVEIIKEKKLLVLSSFPNKYYYAIKALGFQVNQGTSRWPTPFFNPLLCLLLLTGTVYLFFRLFKKRRPEDILLLVWVLGGVFVSGVLVEDIMDCRYLIVIPGIITIISLGFVFIYRTFFRKLPPGFLTFFIFIVSIYCFFDFINVETRKAWRFYPNSYSSTVAGKYLAQIKSSYTVYFLRNSNMCYSCDPNLEFLSSKKGIDIEQPLSEEIKKIDTSKPIIFMILPERENEIEVLKDYWFQNFRVEKLINPDGNTVLLLVRNF